MKFSVQIIYNRKRYNVHAERVYADNQVEHFRVGAGVRNILIQSNRPMLKARGLKHWKPKWKLLEGNIRPGGGLEATLNAIEQYLVNQKVL